MWSADLKAALGQRLNLEGIVSSAMVVVKDRHMALPHVSVPDIRYIDWIELHRRGFKGVVFDKDNTLTAPYSLKLWGPLSSSLELCKSVFGPEIAVFSNSAGLYEYDIDGSKARELEGVIGIKVIMHKVKKPAGRAEEIENHFGCKSSQLIMVGDRPFTDIVYGNRNGFLTILTEPLSLAEEPFIVRQVGFPSRLISSLFPSEELAIKLLQEERNLKMDIANEPADVLHSPNFFHCPWYWHVRKLETALVKHWFRRGLKPTSHILLSDALLYVKNTPSL
ncbi:hypothetical protein F2P56_002111 [Juglans regia]|uniref:Uncharacterized protein n=2 Tax=Juglans regia TaxID=51240 RepID=A0A834D4P1_JUGRE|nr:phosphatidylglycerophosphate phosphatase 1, chloroplastic isoform X1 [Juglans regia]KAF5481464.1 hypothetical protein F2P56_002111 [Juglans regia]